MTKLMGFRNYAWEVLATLEDVIPFDAMKMMAREVMCDPMVTWDNVALVDPFDDEVIWNFEADTIDEGDEEPYDIDDDSFYNPYIGADDFDLGFEDEPW